MRNPVFLKSLIGIALMGVAACQPPDLSMDDIDFSLDLNVIKTSVNVQFLDAATGELIGMTGSSEIEIRFSGEEAPFIVDNSGFYLKGVTINGGFLSIGVDPTKVVPTEVDPARLVINAESEGYLPASLPVRIPAEGVYDFKVSMIKISAPPDGVYIAESKNAGTSHNGILANTIIFEPDNSNSLITISADAILKDADGNPLEGNLDAIIARFDPKKDAAIRSLPGGSNAEYINEKGEDLMGTLIPAALFRIEIVDQNGRRADGIPAAYIKVQTAIDPSTINPLTGQPVKTGDTIPIYGYDGSTGKWFYIRDMLIAPGWSVSLPLKSLTGGAGFITICFTVSNLAVIVFHNPYYYPGYWYDFIPLELNYEFRAPDGSLQVEGVINRRVGRDGMGLTIAVPFGQLTLSFSYPRQSEPFWDVPPPVTQDFGTNPRVDISMSINAWPSLNYRVKVILRCRDQRFSFLIPNHTWVACRAEGELTWQYSAASGGYLTFSHLKPLALYHFYVLYKNKWYPDEPYAYYLPANGTENPEVVQERTLVLNVQCR